MKENTPEKVPTWLLERLLADDLDAEERASVLRRLEAEPGGRERLDALRDSNREILDRYPPARMAERIRNLAAPEKRVAPDKRWLALAFAPACALALLILLPDGGGPATEEIRTKGIGPHLQVFRQRKAAPERLANGAWIEPGDRLQLRYVAAGKSHGAIFSLDGAGVVSLHHPMGATAAPLDEGDAVALPFAFELDDAPGFERFFFVTGDAPFPLEPLLSAARSLGKAEGADSDALPLPPEFGALQQSSFLVRKAPSPQSEN